MVEEQRWQWHPLLVSFRQLFLVFNTLYSESSLLDCSKNGQSQVSLACFLGRNTAHNFCAIVNCLLGVESALSAGKSLIDDFCVLVDSEIGKSVCVGPGDRGGGEHTGRLLERDTDEVACC